MTATASSVATASMLSSAKLFHISLEQYQSMIENGILTKDDDVELILGQIFEQMPITPIHAATVRKIRRYLLKRFPDQYEVSCEHPISLPNDSQPEPDCTLAVFREDFYQDSHPTPPDIFIVIEVANSSLYKDRYIKAAAYAGAGIKEYWIVNLIDNKVEVYLEPNENSGTYGYIEQYEAEEEFISPAIGRVKVTDIMVDIK